MELRHLRYFVAVAEELHFGRAAARLHIAQPPLSQQIRKLEEELKVKLFLRAKRRVELTNAGRVFLAEAQQILSQTERAVEAAKRADLGQIGPLVVACDPLAAQIVLPRTLKSFRARFPEVELVLRESTLLEIPELLRQRSADVGLLVPYFESETLQRHIIVPVPFFAALPKSHPLAGRRRVRLGQLADERFVLYSHRLAPGLYEHTIGLCRRAGFTPKVIQEATQYPTLIVMVAAGYGISLIPALGKPAAREDVALVRVEEPWATIQLCMAWEASYSSPVGASFIELVQRCFRKAPPHNRRARSGR